MADKKEDLQKTLMELRKQAAEQLKSIRSGSATNVRGATKARREIARTLTKINDTKGKE